MSLFNPEYLGLFKKKFVKDGFWLVVSQMVLAVSGILVNVFLTIAYGAEGFGVFSIGLKIYLILSLFAVFGCGSSVIKYVSQYKENQAAINQLVSSALLLSLLTSITIVLLAYLFSPLLLSVFDLRDNSILLYFLPGIPLFSLNKIMLGVLNGKRKIKQYAIIQSVRWTLLLLFVLTSIYFFEAGIEEVAIAFPLSELVLFPICLFAVRNDVRFTFLPGKSWMKKNVVFGGQVMFSSAIIDLYTYTDVFMIGIFLNTKAVGIYAFASDISKNLLSLANLIQINLNPIISELWHKGEIPKLKGYLRKVRNTTHLIYFPIIILAVLLYSLFIDFFMGEEFIQSITPFIILCIGIMALSGFKAIYSLPELTGYPGDNLLINIIILLINVVMNYFLLMVWNLEGVALATTISYFSSIVLLYLIVKKRLSINIFN